MHMVTHFKTTLLVLALLSFVVSLSSASAANNEEAGLGSPSIIFAADKGGAGIDQTPQAGPMTQKGKKKKKEKKPQHVTKCQDIEQTCGTPGDARWCSCKEGGSEKTVQCGCKGGGTTGAPSNPQTPGSAF